jgi:F-type H+-transporting ATPase subunit a
MINWNGKRRWVALILLIAGIVVMLTVPPIIPVIQLPGEKYPGAADAFRMTNSLMGSVVVWVLLILLAVFVQRTIPKSGDEVPRGGFYNFFELIFEVAYGFIHNIVGERYFRYIFSFFMTIMLIVLLSNWLELVPGVDSIGFLEARTTANAQGEVEYESGYETTNSGGIYVLNPKCPWVSPAEAAAMTDADKTARADAGCATGTMASAAQSAEAAAPVEATVATEVAPAAGETTTTASDHEVAAGDSSVPWQVLPFVRAPSTDLNMTASLALIAVIMVQVLGFRALGPSYLTKFFNFKTLLTSPLGGIDVAVGLLELIGEFAKILSFSFRLLGNIFAGSILLFVMSFLVPFLPWPFFLLEFFVGVIQALVFGLLTAIFMNQATAGHGGEHEEHAAEAAEAH